MSFSELEFTAQGILLDDTLQAVSDFVDQHGNLLRLVSADLARGLAHPRQGREGLNAERVLRSFILRRIKNWDLRELRERIADGYTLRLFTRFLGGAVPKHDAFQRAFARITAETMERMNAALVKAASAAGLVDSTRLRMDTTVAETDIHYPTDATLLWDATRVVTRLVQKLKKIDQTIVDGFSVRTRRAHRRMHEIGRLSHKANTPQFKAKYRDLIATTQGTVTGARRVVERARNTRQVDLFDDVAVRAVCSEIVRFADLADQVVDQARLRVIAGEAVPASEKLVSIFEPHTDILVRGKARKPTEFGHKIFLAQSGSKIITDYRVLAGNPTDDVHVPSVLQGHKKLFCDAPEVVAADRGFYSVENVATCEDAGVKTVSIPQRGGKKSEEQAAKEKDAQFKKAQRFRVGIEGTISGMLRGRGMRRCLDEGLERFKVFIGAAVFAYNLLIIAEQFAAKKRGRKRKPA